MKMRVLGSQEVVALFAFGGVDGTVVQTRGELLDALAAAEEEAEQRILVVEEQCAEWVRSEIDQFKLAHHGPLLVEVCGVDGPLADRQTPLDMVRRALGISL